ncbi:MAG: hypothetical protein FH758_05565 [Firmicutes bacterium]|nr:hypothetical protein [Bacillota bacterium]
MRNNFLDQFYTIDPHTGDYIIEITLTNYDDIFNSWDSSVYNIRDLDSSLKSFIEDCSSDIDLRKNIILRFNIWHQDKDTVREKIIVEGICTYFYYCLHITRNRFHERIKRAAFYVLTSLVFTIMSIYFRSIVKNEMIHELVLLSLTVGGWVFLWEAFSLLFIQSSELWKKKKQYKRLLGAPMIFKYR